MSYHYQYCCFPFRRKYNHLNQWFKINIIRLEPWNYSNLDWLSHSGMKQRSGHRWFVIVVLSRHETLQLFRLTFHLLLFLWPVSFLESISNSIVFKISWNSLTICQLYLAEQNTNGHFHFLAICCMWDFKNAFLGSVRSCLFPTTTIIASGPLISRIWSLIFRT